MEYLVGRAAELQLDILVAGPCRSAAPGRSVTSWRDGAADEAEARI